MYFFLVLRVFDFVNTHPSQMSRNSLHSLHGIIKSCRKEYDYNLSYLSSFCCEQSLCSTSRAKILCQKDLSPSINFTIKLKNISHSVTCWGENSRMSATILYVYASSMGLCGYMSEAIDLLHIT